LEDMVGDEKGGMVSDSIVRLVSIKHDPLLRPFD
jgi:hypothetical protein